MSKLFNADNTLSDVGLEIYNNVTQQLHQIYLGSLYRQCSLEEVSKIIDLVQSEIKENFT